MALPNKGELTLASSINEMQTLLENQRDSIQASGKGYSTDIEYEKYDSCIFNDVEYISIYEGTHQGRQPDESPTYWQSRKDFDGITDLTTEFTRTTSNQVLNSSDALSISGYTLSLNKGNGSSESVTLPSTNTAQLLASPSALGIDGSILTLNKGNGSSESVTLPSTDLSTYVQQNQQT